MNPAKISEPAAPAESRRSRWSLAGEQLSFLGHELRLLTHGRPARWLVLFFEPSAGVILSYRLDRSFYLLCGPVWTALRVAAFPLFLLLRILSCRHEICFKAQIGRGLQVIHPTLGVVVHGDAILGQGCVLSGGNSVGIRKPVRPGELVLGDEVMLGLNACVLGPVKVGNRVSLGAGAILVNDLPDDAVAVGVPARPRPVNISG
jgi:serine acetyltransferase